MGWNGWNGVTWLQRTPENIGDEESTGGKGERGMREGGGTAAGSGGGRRTGGGEEVTGGGGETTASGGCSSGREGI